MNQRVTIILDDVVVRKLRNIQSKMIKKEGKCSFSKVLNDQLRDALK